MNFLTGRVAKGWVGFPGGVSEIPFPGGAQAWHRRPQWYKCKGAAGRRMDGRALERLCQHGLLSGLVGRPLPAIVLWVPTGERFGEACTLTGLLKKISLSIFSSAVNGDENAQ